MDLGEEQGGAFRGAPQRREPTLGSGGPPSPFASIPSPQARPDPLLGPPQAFTPPSQIGEMPGSSLRERALAAQSPEDFAALLSDDSLFGGPSEGTPIDESPAPAPASATQGATQQAARPSKAAGPKFAEQEPALLEEEMPLISALDHVTRHKPPEPTGRPEYDFELRDIDESQFMDWVKQIEGYKPEVYDDVGAAAGYFGHRFGPGEEFDPNLTPEEHLQVGLTLLDQDMSLARMHAKRAAESIDPDFDFEAAPPSVQYKLMERAYNMGPKFHLHPSSSKNATVDGYPKWTRAVMEGDVETELREFHRRSQGKGLDERNRSYLKIFHRSLSPEDRELILRGTDPKTIRGMTRNKIMSILNKNKSKNFVQRILRPNDFPTLDLGDGRVGTHLMATSESDGRFFAYPTILFDGGRLVDYGEEAFRKARELGDVIEFKTPEEAEYFATRYKTVWGEN